MDIRQSTAVTIQIGPLLDSAGAPVTSGLAVGTVDEIGVYKEAGTSLVDISGDTTLTHQAGGIWTVTFDAGDTDTVGGLLFVLRDDDVCLPYSERFRVLPPGEYDSLYTAPAHLSVTVTETPTTATDQKFAVTGITEETADHFNMRRFRWTSGNGKQSSYPIADTTWDAVNSQLIIRTMIPMVDEPNAGDTGVFEL